MKLTNGDKGRMLAGFGMIVLFSALSFPWVTCETTSCDIATYLISIMFTTIIVFSFVFAFTTGLRD